MKKLSVISLIISLLFILSCEDKKDTTPPTVSILSLMDGETITGTVIVRVNSEDDEGVSKIEFYIDEKIVYTDSISPYEYEWNTTLLTNKSYSFYVKSIDINDNFTDSEKINIITFNGKIIFNSTRDQNSEIYSMNMDGSDQKNLTSNSSDDYAYQITPDGMKILFTSNREGNDDIYLMDLDGGNVTNLTFTTENEYRPKVTNDGSKIFYISSVGINYTKVSSMNIDGSSIDIKYWTGKDNRFWLSPLDETFLLYASQQYSSPRPNIHRMNIDYSDPELLINFYYSTDVDFHPSDKNIFAYIGREQNESKFKIYLYDMSNMSYITNSRKELIDDPSILGYYDPTFSMDGNKIYVRVQNNDGDLSTSIYSMNLDGTNFTKIFDGEIDYIDGGNMFKFSNDGEYIYTSHRKNASVSDILVMNIDGTDQKYLTSSNRFNRFVDLIINN